jgi:serine/threonine protein kinase
MSEEMGKITKPTQREISTCKLSVKDASGRVLQETDLGVGTYSIGRNASNDVMINDTYVSRKHASLYVQSNLVEIMDANSTGGTFLDGVRVTSRSPAAGNQRIQIGEFYLTVSQNEQSDLSLNCGDKLFQGRFTLQECLGRGTSAEVWRASDGELQEDIALKVFYNEWQGQGEFLSQLRREVKQTRNLNHENILNVYDIHVSGGLAFLTMEYVKGGSLEDVRQRKGIIDWAELMPLMEQLCGAVDYAHSKKIVHRDIKPANILIDHDRVVKLADFGVARTIVTSTFSREATTGSSNQQMAGTMLFMSPQVLKGEPPSPSDDIYAMGVTLYLLLTGYVPFYDKDLQALTDQICNQPARPIGQVIAEQKINNSVPQPVCELIMACLSKDQSKRPDKAMFITANRS